MRSTALPSHLYGDPMEILAAKQAQEAREKRQGKRPILHVKGWSKEREAAEALFDLPKNDRS
jgi:hypothetical protein